jgi:hypothetical protein
MQVLVQTSLVSAVQKAAAKPVPYGVESPADGGYGPWVGRELRDLQFGHCKR